MSAGLSAAGDAGVVIVGAGVGGLTLALALHQRGIGCRVYEAAAEIAPLGVGINILPHATAELEALGMLPTLEALAVTTKEAGFFNRFGQHVYSEPLGRFAGHATPQLSIHRGDLQGALLAEVRARLGAESVVAGHACTRAEDLGSGVRLHFRGPAGEERPEVRGAVAIGCDGIHSALRKQLHPDDGPPRYSGVNMWRGTVPHAPFLSGATMVRAGWLSVGKMVIYPIRENVDGRGAQLVNWVAELESPEPVKRDWSTVAKLDDFFPAFADWHFDWLDVAAMIRATEHVLAYPMVDQDPLPRWSFGRLSLLGDAAHPMVPRGSNGAGQAILDARCLADLIAEAGAGPEALAAYDAVRNPATAKVVLMNRSAPPDAILQVVHERSGDKPFSRIDEVVSQTEMRAITSAYKQVTVPS